MILRSLRFPPAADSFSVRNAVGTDATCPNSSHWSPIARKPLITRAPSAIAHARSDKTRPRSCPPSGDGSAADRPAVPVRSASCHSTSPECDTTPEPPPVTSRLRDHPVACMQKVLPEPGVIKNLDTPYRPRSGTLFHSGAAQLPNPRE
jgi:hypothetical protein